MLCNTGCRPDTIERKLTTADAAVWVHILRKRKAGERKLENVRWMVNRVKEFMGLVFKFRETL